MHTPTGLNSHLTETFMLFTGAKQGKGCDCSARRSWADGTSGSKRPCPLTGAQGKPLGKIILWLKHKTRRAEPCSQQSCSTLSVWPRASHEFSVPVSSLVNWWRWSCLFSAELWVFIILHFQEFLILCRKYIANITALPLHRHVTNSNKCIVHTSPLPHLLSQYAPSENSTHTKALFISVKQRRTWKAGWEQHLSRLALQVIRIQNIRLMGFLTKYDLSPTILYCCLPKALDMESCILCNHLQTQN